MSMNTAQNLLKKECLSLGPNNNISYIFRLSTCPMLTRMTHTPKCASHSHQLFHSACEKRPVFLFDTKASLSALSWSDFRGQQTNKPPRSGKTRPLCDSCIMSRPCNTSLSWCFLCFLLAFHLHDAWSAPDFSGKFFFGR